MERGLFFPLGKSGIAEPTLLPKGRVAEGGRGVPCPSSRFFLCLGPPPCLSSVLESCRLSDMWPLHFRVHSHLLLLCYYEFRPEISKAHCRQYLNYGCSWRGQAIQTPRISNRKGLSGWRGAFEANRVFFSYSVLSYLFLQS